MGTKSVDTVLVKVMRNSYVRVNDTTLAHSSHVDPPLKPRFNCSPIEAIETQRGFRVTYPKQSLWISTFAEPGPDGRFEQFLVTPGE